MPSGDRRPNVLVLMSDQHSKHFLGCYGNEIVRTPHLDHLAERGMRFDAAYCPSPLCVPSRMSFMTGRTPTGNRVWSNQDVLSSTIPTWAHGLGVAGYGTALVGRMHFVGPDQRHGFERRPIGEYSATFPGAPRLGGPLFRRIPAGTSGQCRISVEAAGYGRTTYQAFDELVADAACRYLDEKAGEPDGRPFAAVVGFVLPHCPFFAPKELFEYYYERVDLPPQWTEPAPAAIRRFRRLRGIEESLPLERIRVARAAYYGMCEHLDAQVGRVLDKLTEHGLHENTLVIYTSDHGEMAGEHGCWWKSNYYEGSASVPLIASLPGLLPEGQGSNAVCSLIDLGPTMLDMAQADPLPAADGRSLWPILLGDPAASWPDTTFSELLGGVGDPPSRMVRSGAWKLFAYHGDPQPALFNLKDDPTEDNDLGAHPGHREVRERLLALVQEGWDPDLVLRASSERERDMRLVTQWGRTLQPRHEDALPIPDVEDVEFR